MNLLTLRHAGARARRRLTGDDDDGGFALIYVMMITAIIAVAVATSLGITANGVVAARQSQNSETAYAAAQAGVQDYVAYLNGRCAVFNNVACSSINGTRVNGVRVAGADSTGTATYDRQVVNPTTVINDGYVRVRVTGRAGGASRTIVADIMGLPNVLRFSYLSQYETLGSTFLSTYYRDRTINLVAGSAAATAAARSGTVHWNAPTASGTGGVNVCDKLWYDDGTNTASAADSGVAASAGRATIKSTVDAGLPVGTDWTASGTAGTFAQPCEVTFSSGMQFTGPVYTQDAPYLTSGTAAGTGPTFVSNDTAYPAVSTAWLPTSTPGAVQSYRTFPYLPTGPSSTSTGYPTSTIQSRRQVLRLPANADAAKASANCIYTGPTRIVLNGSIATVTSPQTRTRLSGNAGCYPASLTNGVVQFSFDYTTVGGLIYVSNDNKPAGGFATTGQTSSSTPSASDSVFYLSNSAANGTLDSPTTVAPNTCSASATYVGANAATTCSWSNASSPTAGSSWVADGTGWTSYSTKTCDKTTATDEQNFNCEFNSNQSGGTPPGGQYAIYQQRIKDALATSSYSVGSTVAGSCANQTFNPQTATSAQTACLLASFLRPADTGSAASGSTPPTTGTAHQYVVSTGATTTTTATKSVTGATAPTSPISSDPLFTTSSGSGATETVTTKTTTYTVNRETESCSLLNVLGACVGTWTWGNDVPQFQVRVTNTGYSNLMAGSPSTAYFPNMNDVTQYATGGSSSTVGPGDVYLEGTGISGAISIVAENDAIVTGPLKTTYRSDSGNGANEHGNRTWTGGGAVGLVADNNVRIYHPVSCAVADSVTSAGYCANDITGLYSGGLETNGKLQAGHPARQYCNMTPGLGDTTSNSLCTSVTTTGTGAVGEIDAAVFALTGSLLTDNYNRGVTTDFTAPPVTVNGGIYQKHRGATGQQWETVLSDSSRASSGYTLQDAYLDLTNANLPYVPALVNGSNSRAWNVVSTSNGKPLS